MSDLPRPPEPGERRLDRPPSDRFRDPRPDLEPVPGPTGSAARAVGAGVLAGIAGAIATVVLGGVIGLSAGLLVVAAATGWGIGTGTRIGAREAAAGPSRHWPAVAIAAAAVVVGQLGLWLYARSEGGVLPLPDYLGATFGVLVPAQAAIALGVAWWTAR